MEKASAKQKLLEQCFLNFFKGELPTDDDGMFALITGLFMARNCYELCDEIFKRTGFDYRDEKYKQIMNDMFEKCENGIKEYICEVKGFKRFFSTKKYITWFHMMVDKFSSSNEKMCKEIIRNSEDIIDIFNKMLIYRISHN